MWPWGWGPRTVFEPPETDLRPKYFSQHTPVPGMPTEMYGSPVGDRPYRTPGMPMLQPTPRRDNVQRIGPFVNDFRHRHPILLMVSRERGRPATGSEAIRASAVGSGSCGAPLSAIGPRDRGYDPRDTNTPRAFTRDTRPRKRLSMPRETPRRDLAKGRSGTRLRRSAGPPRETSAHHNRPHTPTALATEASPAPSSSTP